MSNSGWEVTVDGTGAPPPWRPAGGPILPLISAPSVAELEAVQAAATASIVEDLPGSPSPRSQWSGVSRSVPFRGGAPSLRSSSDSRSQEVAPPLLPLELPLAGGRHDPVPSSSCISFALLLSASWETKWDKRCQKVHSLPIHCQGTLLPTVTLMLPSTSSTAFCASYTHCPYIGYRAPSPHHASLGRRDGCWSSTARALLKLPVPPVLASPFSDDATQSAPPPFASSLLPHPRCQLQRNLPPWRSNCAPLKTRPIRSPLLRQRGWTLLPHRMDRRWLRLPRFPRRSFRREEDDGP
jgi:hypothetical protein